MGASQILIGSQGIGKIARSFVGLGKRERESKGIRELRIDLLEFFSLFSKRLRSTTAIMG